jgi:predicted transcriptional regulator
MEKKSIKELMSTKYIEVSEDTPIHEVINKLIKTKDTMLVYVCDNQGKLIGIIRPKEVLKLVEIKEYETSRYPNLEGPAILGLLSSRYAKDIMTAAVSVHLDDGIEKAINIMLDEDFYEVPVVDKTGKLIGQINYFSIISLV